MSWYRTYRSQRIADLDITPVRDAFTKILSSGEFSHAYLLAGPKGTGKTSAARILAKVLNCEKNRQPVEVTLTKGLGIRALGREKKLTPKPQALISLSEPCNVCASCVAITSGSSMSVTEMDAASNRGIDDIRLLRERIGLSPPDGIISVFIIDEVHMLTTEAFNALLKVLEEPPAHVVFILATTDAQKMPATVVSRCTLIQYRKATAAELTQRLQAIATAEGIEVSTESLTLIATAADGSFRDGVKLFEQIATGVKKLDTAQVSMALGGNASRLAAELLTALLKKESAPVVAIFSQLGQQGIDGIAFQKEVLTLAHGKLVELAAKNDARLSSLVALLRAIAVPIEPHLVMPWLPFEIACVEFALANSTQQTVLSAQQTVPSEEKHEVKPVTIKHQAHKEPPKEILVEVPIEVPVAPPQPVIPPAEPKPEKILREPSEISFELITSQWPTVLAKVRSKSVPLEGLVKSIRLVGIDGKTVRLEASYQFHKEQMELSRNILIIEEILESVYSAKLHYGVELGKAAIKIVGSPHSNVTGTVEDEKLVKAAEEAFL